MFEPIILFFLGALGVLNTLTWLLAYKWGLDSLRVLGDPEPKPLSLEPFVSVIVPARNEASNLPFLLDSLLSQDYERYEVVVVDDNSSDNTFRVALDYARRDSRIKPVRNNMDPPPGWSPKVYAILRGLERVRPDASILVFLDADTRLLADNVLRILVSNAYHSGGIVSLNPRFECPTRRCRIAETILTTFAHSFLGFNRVLDPGHELAWFYGCCWAIKREVYESLGGHYAVRHSIVEDRDLAEKAKSTGVPLLVLRAWRLVETKWYPGLRDSVKVLARLMRRHARKRARTLVEASIIALSYLLPVVNIALGLLTGNPLLLVVGVVNYVTVGLAHVIGARVNGYSLLYALLAPFAGIILSWGLIEAVRTRGLEWRSRRISVGG